MWGYVRIEFQRSTRRRKRNNDYHCPAKTDTREQSGMSDRTSVKLHSSWSSMEILGAGQSMAGGQWLWRLLFSFRIGRCQWPIDRLLLQGSVVQRRHGWCPFHGSLIEVWLLLFRILRRIDRLIIPTGSRCTAKFLYKFLRASSNALA